MGRAQGRFAAAPAARRRKFTDETLRAELEAFTADRDDWPTAKELKTAGRGDLANAVGRTGGAARWATELGKRLNRSQTKVHRWNDDEIGRQLREFVGGAQEFPSIDAFIAADRYDLCMALKRHGGIGSWRTRIGLPGTPRTSWTDATLEEALCEFLGDRPDWPTRHEFRAAGRQELIRAIRRRGGVIPWAKRLGKTVSERQRRQAEHG